MGRGERYTVRKFLAAIPGSGGLTSVIAERVGCDWHTARRWIEEHPSLYRAYEAERNAIDDLAEAVVVKAIREGDVDIAWRWLRARRRQEFGDSLDVTSGGRTIAVEWRTYGHGPTDE